jgi:tetraacyldisaccharide 4'-kinase
METVGMARLPDDLFFIGRPLAPLYAMAMRVRAELYRRGVFLQHRLAVPVVSVGNLTLGGTGKTPMVLHLARLLAGCGLKPAVVSRGYGGRAKQPVNVVSDGQTLLLPAALAGDEPRLLAENLAGVPVLTGIRRVLVGQAAIDSLGADIIVLDDGFQHLALRRDLDLALFNAGSPLGNGRVFPGGPLREPVPALARAHAFIITGVDETTSSQAADFQGLLRDKFPGKPVFTAGYRAEGMMRLTASGSTPVAPQETGRLFAFCGLARPDSFRDFLAREGISVAGFATFQDHHRYTAPDLAELEQQARASGAAGLITTEKDAVKLVDVIREPLPLYFLKVSMAVEDGLDAFVLQHLGLSGQRADNCV